MLRHVLVRSPQNIEKLEVGPEIAIIDLNSLFELMKRLVVFVLRFVVLRVGLVMLDFRLVKLDFGPLNQGSGGLFQIAFTLLFSVIALLLVAIACIQIVVALLEQNLAKIMMRGPETGMECNRLTIFDNGFLVTSSES